MKDNILEKIKDVIRQGFKLKIEFVDDDWTLWNQILESMEYAPIDYTDFELRYQEEYMRCFFRDVHNLSFIIFQNNKPIGLWPLTMSRQPDGINITTNTKEILCPLFVRGISEKTRKLAIDGGVIGIMSIAEGLGNEGIFDRWKARCVFLQELGENDSLLWFRKCMEIGGSADVITELYVNLELPLDIIHRRVRKSYRALINRAESLWHVDVLDSVSREQYDEFHKKHVEIAGCQTRSRETWDIQRETINSGHGFLVRLQDDNANYVGEGYFEYSKDEGSYSVGVYDRSLFDKPVSHLVQWKAIGHMRELGVKRYRIGQRFWSGKTMNLVRPTEKELSISYFKEGFATDYIETLIVTNEI